MGWSKYFPILAGLGTLWFLGDEPGWPRTIAGFVLGLMAGVAADMAWPWLLRAPEPYVQHWVILPLIGPYGLSVYALYLPFAILGATVAARRNWVRIRNPNDLRR